MSRDTKSLVLKTLNPIPGPTKRDTRSLDIKPYTLNRILGPFKGDARSLDPKP